MRRGNILAHRGLWKDPGQKNTGRALREALELGFGIETDLRDANTVLAISHDPVSQAGMQPAAQFFSDYHDSGCGSRLALNIKADGLQALTTLELEAAKVPVQNVYAFDMSVPDALGYIRTQFPVYTRISEYETHPSFLDDAVGVWVDSFNGAFPQVEKAAELLEHGLRVSIVSSELHGRPHEDLWQQISRAGLNTNDKFEICTDFPEEAHQVFGTD